MYIVSFTSEQKRTEAISWYMGNNDLKFSGDERDRTANLLVANQALSQLSYVPRVGGRRSGDRLGSPNVNFMIATAAWFG